MTSRVRERTLERLVRVAAADLGTAELIDEAGALLAAALPHDAGCWHTTDPGSMIETGYRAHHMPPPDAAVARFAYLPDDYNSFARLAAGRPHSGVLSELTGGQLSRSVRYRELLRPNNITGELRIALLAGGDCWGNVSLFRESPRDFTPDERDFADQLSGVLGGGLRQAGVRARCAPDSETRWPGVLVLDGAGEIATISEPARSWLAELGAREDEALPFALIALAERARTDRDAWARVRADGGRWISLHASATGDQVAFVLQEAHPGAIAPLLYAAFAFTTREREIADLVVQGCSTAAIAERLFISPLTVQTHLTSIFAKTGRRSRRQLTGLLTGAPDAGNTRNLG
ncbi:helix-turn-helix transcriptional regulator [Nocardia huaxiensis]|uniref:helix-turn-helix transcriptional regulator n=1 Tax=Nocardia huaxiensis TaxID=2755382 RepID=UPI001E2FD9EE|nr:helix-turn-helix transcriptional regulator [Nocardia huaxiensis]UFS98283.1 helix-turn-helix transcriptional regulator [Nocardia huaxiensis]